MNIFNSFPLSLIIITLTIGNSQANLVTIVYNFNMKEFNERLKELRTLKNLSQEQLAKETGISSTAICYYETGQRVPNANVIIVLAKYFNVSSDYLLGLNDY